MNTFLMIFAGGGLGAVTRHYTVTAMAQFFGNAFPYGVLGVNILGSFLMGVFMEAVVRKWQLPFEGQAFLAIGFLGGFTTFSAFSADVMKLTQAGSYTWAALYISLSVCVSIAAIFGGAFLARTVMG